LLVISTNNSRRELIQPVNLNIIEIIAVDKREMLSFQLSHVLSMRRDFTKTTINKNEN